jgi:uncharacterized membrane protein
MGKNRLETFSDGVLAIIITIMVLEMKVPHEATWNALAAMFPAFVSYILSFIYVGIYWNNHHHLMHAVRRINGRIMWANAHLLFWLSLMPFASGWMGENHFAPLPTALMGVILFMAGVAYYILSQSLIRLHGKDSILAKAVGRDLKGILSVLIYAAAIGLAFVNSWISFSFYVLVALIWLVPDSRIEHTLEQEIPL